MPIIIERDDGTYVYEDPPSNPPPLPKVYPDVSPVDDLRRRTVNEYELSEAARQSLYETPTEYRNVPSDITQAREQGWMQLGQYKPPLNQALTGGPTIEVANYGPYGDPVQTLQHEHAHKWWHENIPQANRNQFMRNWRQMPEPARAWESYGTEPLRKRMEMLGLVTRSPAREAHATWAEQPQTIPEVDRNRYYPGLFQPKWR